MAAGLVLPCALLLGVFPGCSLDKEKMEFDTSFSYNVIRTPLWFPGKDTPLTPPQEEYVARHGPPDYFRLWWNDDGAFVNSSDLHQQFKSMPEHMQNLKQTWVYLKQGKEVEFSREGALLEHPITDKLKFICTLGDPSAKNPPKPDSKGRQHETWIWYDRGMMIEFVDNAESKRSTFTGTGRGTDVSK